MNGSDSASVHQAAGERQAGELEQDAQVVRVWISDTVRGSRCGGRIDPRRPAFHPSERQDAQCAGPRRQEQGEAGPEESHRWVAPRCQGRARSRRATAPAGRPGAPVDLRVGRAASGESRRRLRRECRARGAVAAPPAPPRCEDSRLRRFMRRARAAPARATAGPTPSTSASFSLARKPASNASSSTVRIETEDRLP